MRLAAAVALIAVGYFLGAWVQDARCEPMPQAEALDVDATPLVCEEDDYGVLFCYEPSAEAACEGDMDCVEQCLRDLRPDEDEEVCYDVLGPVVPYEEQQR